MALLREPQTNAAKVFMFGESGAPQTMKFWRFFASPSGYAPPDSASLIPISHPNDYSTDLFCSGHATLADGRLLMMGEGWIAPEPCRDVYVLDPAWMPGDPAEPWTEYAPMAVERWYGTATTMADGRVLATAGTMSSRVLGFGGVQMNGDTYRVLHPIDYSSVTNWGDTLAVPGNNPPSGSRVQNDTWTARQFPPPREFHALASNYSGEGVLYGGRKVASGSPTVLDDVWLLKGSIIDDDSTHIWLRAEQFPDTILGTAVFPPARSHHAMVWAGLENRGTSRLPGADTHPVCFIYGGLTASGQPLGDVWRGERVDASAYHPFPDNHYAWQWRQLWADDPATRRFGHTMMFDPGPSPPGTPDGALYARLVVQGGRTSTTTFADHAVLRTFGVGSSAGHEWKTVTPGGTQGVPPAREGHAVTWKTKSTRPGIPREFLQYGGTDASGTVVAGDMWALTRNDDALSDSLAYSWKKLPVSSSSPTPAARTRAGLAYVIDGSLTTIVGGDTDGGGTSTGLTNEIWNLVPDPDAQPGSGYLWVSPSQRAFHPAPPPIAGMTLIAAGEGNGRIARALELFTTTADSPPLSGDPCPQPMTLPGQWSVVTTNSSESMRRVADYAQMFLLPDGRVFYTGPAPWGNLNDPRAKYRRFFNVGSQQWADGNSSGQSDAIHFGSSVMYRPGSILRAGQLLEGGVPDASNRTETINIANGAPNPLWVEYDGVSNPSLLARMAHNLTVLPTGDVLASGGVSATSPTLVGERRPQIWKTALGSWSNPDTVSASNTELLARDPFVRNYHSTAILLPDGRVLTTGGEKPSADEMTASVFEPPYLFQGNTLADRPEIGDAPEKPGYGGTFTLTLAAEDTNRVANVKSIGLIRPSAVTHGFDQNQRYVPLGFVATGSPKRLLVQSPPDSFIAPPGDYMLFVVDSIATNAPRVPSIAKWVVVGRDSGTPRDSLDVIAPRGGSYLALEDLSTCPNLSADLTIGWNAPADDDTLGFSGLARAYNLRYKLNSNAEPDFNQWTVIPTSAPAPVFTPEATVLSGLSAAVWYRFQLKSVGDNADTSSLSNALVAKPLYCEDDGGAGSGGEGGYSARGAGRYSANGGSNGLQENSILSGPLASGPRTDALRLPKAPRLASGQRLAYIWQGGARGLALDRVRLVVVDRGETERSVVSSDGNLICGNWSAATAVSVSGIDVTSTATGSTLEPLYADSGSVLSVQLPTSAGEAGAHLWLECSAGGGGGGVAVVREEPGSAPDTLARIHPRRRWSEHAVPLSGSGTISLRFDGAYALRSLGVLSNTHGADTIVAPLTSAIVTGGPEQWAEASALDGSDCVVPSGDTLLMSFSEPSSGDGIRDWYLVVEGQPLPADIAAARARRAKQEQPTPALVFRLHSNTPNPFRRSTHIRFDLPTSGATRLEIFDAQGRLVRSINNWSPAGRNSVEWDQRDRVGHLVGAGIYHYRLRWAGREAREKMVVLP